MIINVKNKKDTITVDIRCKQIRYLKGSTGPLQFHNLSRTDADSYEYLFGVDKTTFLEALAEDVSNYLNVPCIDESKLEIIQST